MYKRACIRIGNYIYMRTGKMRRVGVGSCLFVEPVGKGTAKPSHAALTEGSTDSLGERRSHLRNRIRSCGRLVSVHSVECVCDDIYV